MSPRNVPTTAASASRSLVKHSRWSVRSSAASATRDPTSSRRRVPSAGSPAMRARSGAITLDRPGDFPSNPYNMGPDSVRPLHLLDASIRPYVRAAHAGGRDADDRVGRLDDLRRLALLDPDIAGPVHHRAAHQAAAVASSWARLVDS